jgi:hypothetical protein
VHVSLYVREREREKHQFFFFLKLVENIDMTGVGEKVLHLERNSC